MPEGQLEQVESGMHMTEAEQVQTALLMHAWYLPAAQPSTWKLCGVTAGEAHDVVANWAVTPPMAQKSSVGSVPPQAKEVYVAGARHSVVV